MRIINWILGSGWAPLEQNLPEIRACGPCSASAPDNSLGVRKSASTGSWRGWESATNHWNLKQKEEFASLSPHRFYSTCERGSKLANIPCSAWVVSWNKPGLESAGQKQILQIQADTEFTIEPKQWGSNLVSFCHRITLEAARKQNQSKDKRPLCIHGEAVAVSHPKSEFLVLSGNISRGDKTPVKHLSNQSRPGGCGWELTPLSHSSPRECDLLKLLISSFPQIAEVI